MHIRMSAAEKSSWEAKARKCKMSKSAYIRSLLNSSDPKQPPPIEYHQMINQLNQISTALNEIAMIAKRTGHIESAKYAQIVKLVQNILLKIMSDMSLPERR